MADNTAKRMATCACGALSATCAGDPAKVSMCHCAACQRRTGAPFSIAAFFPLGAVDINGESRSFRRPSDKGPGADVVFHFCPNCGTNLYWHAERMPHLVGIAVGAFADPAFPAPEQSVYNETRHPWFKTPEIREIF